jgi:Ala-tRNA(Pro) deacylase
MDQAPRTVNPLSAVPPAGEREAALYARLKQLGIAWRTHEHAEVFTVEQAQGLRGTIAGTHTKNLFLKNRKGGLWLVVLREEVRVDLNALAKQLEAGRFSFASSATLADVLGVPPGSVTPFALINDFANRVKVVLDREMLGRGPLNFHPLRNDRTTTIAASDLSRFIGSCGHEPFEAVLPEIG